ncbi:MFS transporter [Pseudonocardia acaciae]|uniref:MFS transporter n=1 Tax=Pseudonocardia acaciae TaxID=551276 RepID=UPI00056068D6|nr:MFS transporter [Pseudonocardia acaciae]
MTAAPSPPSPPSRGATATIAARLERLPATSWQRNLRLLLGTVTFFEGFDQLLVAYTLPLIKTEWSLTGAQLTLGVTAGSVGMLLGALACGGLADRIGRTRVVVVAMLLTALASLALVACPNFELFTVLRFVQGLGIGGEVPVAAALISELSRARGRGRFVLLYELAFPAGLTAAAVIASVVVPAFGWRALYLIGAVPAVLAFPVIRFVPESPRWLASRGLTERAETAMAGIERAVSRACGGPLPDAEVSPAAAQAQKTEPPGRVAELVGRRYLRRTAVVSVLWFGGYFVNYGLTAWLPTLYTSLYHVPIGTALNYTLLTSLVGFLGCVVVALVVDRIGRRTSLVLGLGVGGLLLLVLAALGATGGGSVALWSTLSAGFVFAANICLYLYTSELYPTRIRALGSSLGGAWNRLGVILGPVVVGALVSAGAAPAVVFAVLGAVGIVSGAIALAGEETAGRRLEEISA